MKNIQYIFSVKKKNKNNQMDITFLPQFFLYSQKYIIFIKLKHVCILYAHLCIFFLITNFYCWKKKLVLPTAHRDALIFEWPLYINYDGVLGVAAISKGLASFENFDNVRDNGR